MTDNEAKLDVQKRVGVERRSRVDTRPEEERRSQIDRRLSRSTEQPSKEQLALFAKRVRRAIRDEGARHNFGTSSGDGDFRGHPDVLRSLEWIEGLANS